MTVDEIIAFTESLGGVLTQRPTSDDPDVPEIAWGDTFFHCCPDGEIRSRSQPFATIVTKAYPGEPASDLDADGAFRVNIGVGRAEFARRTGVEPSRAAQSAQPFAVADEVVPHPTYARAGWVSVINPAHSADVVRELLATAHKRARGTTG